MFVKCEKTKEKNGRIIAIIGAGPAGLSAAGELICRGYTVHIYDQMPEPGGLMIFGALERNLDKKIIREEIKKLEKHGVIFHLKEKIDEKKFEELRKKFDAVLIATGTWRERKLNIPGKNLRGVFYALDYLTDYHLWKYGYKPYIERLFGTTLVVGGGGLTAVDACYVAKEMGSKKIFLSYRKRIKDSKARAELEKLSEIGVEFLECTIPVEILGKEIVEKVRLVKTEVIEKGGESQIKPVEGSAFEIEVNNVLIAVGEIPSEVWNGIEVDETGRIKTSNYRTNIEKVFAAGDIEQGPTLIGIAMKRGREAAQAIDEYLSRKSV